MKLKETCFQLTDKVSTLDVTNGKQWKALRKNVSPAFSSGKLKAMLAPIGDVVNRFLVHVGEKADKGSAVPVKPMLEGN